MGGWKPIIGITSGFDYEKDMLFVKSGYYEGIREAGGIPLIIPPEEDMGIIDGLMEVCQGFLLSGGPDIDACYFGESNLQGMGNISPCRDVAELYIANKAFVDKKPIFGICRGIQVMNVALGGTLYQDIHSQLKGIELLKHSQDAPRWYPSHDIHISEDSYVARAFGSCCGRVNSFHHQAVKDVAEGFAVTSRSKDGIIESIEYTGSGFAVGVQWHPELMWQKERKHLNLFREFVASAAKGDASPLGGGASLKES